MIEATQLGESDEAPIGSIVSPNLLDSRETVRSVGTGDLAECEHPTRSVVGKRRLSDTDEVLGTVLGERYLGSAIEALGEVASQGQLKHPRVNVGVVAHARDR